MDRAAGRLQRRRNATLYRQDRSIAGLTEAPQLWFERLPAVFPLYVRALRLWRRGAPTSTTRIPSLSASAAPFVPDQAHLQRFCALVGHRNPGMLPLTFPQVLAAPLQLALLTSKDFPLNPSGIVHVSNRIVLHRPLPATESIALTVSLSEQNQTHRGRELALETRAGDAAGEPVWQASATLLVRYAAPQTGKAARGTRTAAEPMHEVASFPVPAGTGRRYARVSGDYNPIHLSAATARLLGFKRAIAHGMWSLARVLGVLSEADAPQQVDVRFRRPLFMPADVALYSSQGDPATFALRDRKSQKNYLCGALSDPT